MYELLSFMLQVSFEDGDSMLKTIKDAELFSLWYIAFGKNNGASA